MSRLWILSLIFGAACTTPVSPPETPAGARFVGTVDPSVTHVMAVSPVAGDLRKVIVPTDAQAFALTVETHRPWVLVFVDANQVGAAMVAAVLRADTLDTVFPTLDGDVDLGAITNGATMPMADLEAALGLDHDTGVTIGGIDDLALRYVNPDIDADGVLDIEQGHDARLEIHADYQLVAAGRAATLDDLVADPEAITYEHVGTGIYGRLPDAFGPVDHASASITFEQPLHALAAGVANVIPAGTPVTELTFGDDQTFGTYALAGFEIPHGNYHFQSGDRTLEFTMVRPPDDSMQQLVPQLRFVPVDSACRAACRVASIDFTWRRHTEAGWVAVTDVEADLLRPTARVDLFHTTTGHHAGFALPAGLATGSLPWDTASYDGMTHEQLVAASTGDFTYVNVELQTQPGIKMYASLGN